jgi:hypothetical protein
LKIPNNAIIEMPSAEIQQAAFLSIPAEIRALIYAQVLICPEPIDLSTNLPYTVNSTAARHTIQTFLALSWTCKRTYHEVPDVFFTQNTFSFLANRPLPSIPARYVEIMRNITLYRTLVGRNFYLKIQKRRNGNVGTAVEAAGCQKEDVKVDTSTLAANAERVIERMIRTRLTQGARVAALMLQRAVDRGQGIGMRELENVAVQLNCQWVIAI